ncbi:MAG: thiopeptide-type bacteriocin biosynthesis protein [Mediterranea sp.]|jgi:thiopeptide-type bacteriocin biosynthesis protein|nr:thiopeptide-type bacteriocin biosynthesis protein [Mediterranea sp.]
MSKRNVVRRDFIPGSEWVYFKIYAGSNTVDKLLVHEISQIIASLERRKLIEKWFFIRYADPDFHLRIRLQVLDRSMIGNVLQAFYGKLEKRISDKTVWKVQLDTYSRELERYKKEFIELTEDLFCVDSRHVLLLLTKMHEKNMLEERFFIAMRTIDCLLNAFNLDISGKQNLLEHIDAGFKSEFGYTQSNMKQLNALYREYRPQISSAMNGLPIDIETAIQHYTVECAKIVERVEARDMREALPSYIHMTMNRIFPSKNRIYELMSYNFLNRYYQSVIARKHNETRKWKTNNLCVNR